MGVLRRPSLYRGCTLQPVIDVTICRSIVWLQLAGTVDAVRQHIGIPVVDDRFQAPSSADRLSKPDPLPSFASVRWVSAMAAKAAGHLRAGSERQSHKSRVPVSRRSCEPAIDPSPTVAISDSMPKS
jgi:hypothetical protein